MAFLVRCNVSGVHQGCSSGRATDVRVELDAIDSVLSPQTKSRISSVSGSMSTVVIRSLASTRTIERGS